MPQHLWRALSVALFTLATTRLLAKGLLQTATHPPNTTITPTHLTALLVLPFSKHMKAKLEIKFTLCSQRELMLIKCPGQTQ